MPGKFEIFKDKSGGFRFRLKAANGQIILASEAYKNKAGCKRGIEAVKNNSTKSERFSKSDTKAGKFLFNLLGANKKVVGTSQQYKTKASRDNGINSVQSNAQAAAIVEVD